METITYRITPACKKSVEEVECWSNEEKGLNFYTEIMWRSGEYLIHLESEDDVELFESTKDDTDEFCLDNFHYELVETHDACSEDYYVLNRKDYSKAEDEYATQLIEKYEEDWSDALYEEGFDSTELTTTIYNGIEYELVEDSSED
jgi:hypothetical protein